MPFHNFRVHAILRTLSGLHIAAPGAAYFDSTTGRLTNIKPKMNEKGFFPATGIQKLLIPAGRVVSAAGDDDDESVDAVSTAKTRGFERAVRVPVIGANNLAGHLRRQAAYMFIEHLRETGQQVDIRTFNVLFCGAASGNPDGADLTFAEYTAARNDLYLGLFGGGPMMFPRSVKIHPGVPLTDETAFMFAGMQHPRDILAGTELEAFTRHDLRHLSMGWMSKRGDPTSDMANLAAGIDIVPAMMEEADERQKSIAAERAAKRAAASSKDADKKRTSTYSVSALEFVPPGVEFPLTFDLSGTTAHLGFLLKCLDRLAATTPLGGHSRNGFGRFILRDVAITPKDGDPIFDVFENGRLSGASVIQGYVAEAEAALAAVNADAFAALVSPAPKKAA